jgi:sec-independent protein translocase protein TatA
MLMLAFLEGPDLVIVALIVLLVFGGSRIPSLARSLGEAQREFRKGLQDEPPKPDDDAVGKVEPTPAERAVDATPAEPPVEPAPADVTRPDQPLT